MSNTWGSSVFSHTTNQIAKLLAHTYEIDDIMELHMTCQHVYGLQNIAKHLKQQHKSNKNLNEDSKAFKSLCHTLDHLSICFLTIQVDWRCLNQLNWSKLTNKPNKNSRQLKNIHVQHETAKK